jgi:hypothetical protein
MNLLSVRNSFLVSLVSHAIEKILPKWILGKRMKWICRFTHAAGSNGSADRKQFNNEKASSPLAGKEAKHLFHYWSRFVDYYSGFGANTIACFCL